MERKNKKGGPVSRVLYPFRGRRHPSCPAVARRVVSGQPVNPPRPWGHGASELLFTARPCSQRGLPCRHRCRRRGGLLPRHFTLARRPRPPGGIFSVALSVPRPRRFRGLAESPGVTRRCALMSPDFPPGKTPKGSPDGDAARLNELPTSHALVGSSFWGSAKDAEPPF